MHRTILKRETATLRGIGLFSGRECAVTVRPGAINTGIVFTAPGRGPVAAHVTRCVDWTPTGWPAGLPIRNTSIGTDGWSVGTTEHVLSALAGLGVADAVIDVEGPEIPILDGSALPFVSAIIDHCEASVEPPQEPLRLRRPVRVEDGGGGVIHAEPLDSQSYTYELDYGPGSPIKPHAETWTGDPGAYTREICIARTFSLRAEAEAAARAGLFKSFTPRDLLVIGDDGEPIDNAWRVPNEPAKHKLLDLIGDLSLLGRPLFARVTARKSGHALTREFCRKVLAEGC